MINNSSNYKSTIQLELHKFIFSKFKNLLSTGLHYTGIDNNPTQISITCFAQNNCQYPFTSKAASMLYLAG